MAGSGCYTCSAHFEGDAFLCENGHPSGQLPPFTQIGVNETRDFNCSQCGSSHYIRMVTAGAYTLYHGNDLR
jgi:hypothetical protein